MIKGTGEDIHPSTFKEEVEGRSEQMVISTMMLRSMQQAHYDDTNLGHFGLSRNTIHILHHLLDVIRT